MNQYPAYHRCKNRLVQYLLADHHNIIEKQMKDEVKMVKVIEVIASSEIGFNEAAQNAVTEAAKTLKNIRSIYIKEMKGHVENDKIVSYAVNAQISFEIEK